MNPDPAILQAIVNRVVEQAKPKRILLFGSAARGEMGPDSDVDLLVIIEDGRHRREVKRKIRQQLWGFPYSIDLVVATETDVEMYGGNWSLVLFPALQEGVEVYAS